MFLTYCFLVNNKFLLLLGQKDDSNRSASPGVQSQQVLAQGDLGGTGMETVLRVTGCVWCGSSCSFLWHPHPVLPPFPTAATSCCEVPPNYSIFLILLILLRDSWPCPWPNSSPKGKALVEVGQWHQCCCHPWGGGGGSVVSSVFGGL